MISSFWNRYKLYLLLIFIVITLILNSGLIKDTPLEQFLVVKETDHPGRDVIETLVDSVFQDNDIHLEISLTERNKFSILEEDSLIGYAYIVIMPVRNPVISNVNFILIIEIDNLIKEFIFYKQIIERGRIIPVQELQTLTDLLDKRYLYTFNFDSLTNKSFPNEFSVFILRSLSELQRNLNRR